MHGLYFLILGLALLLSNIKGHEWMPGKAVARPKVEHKNSSRQTGHLPVEPRSALKNARLNFRLLPPASVPGNLTIELENASEDHLGLVQFTISVFGQSGELHFEDLAAGAKKSQSVLIESRLELAVTDVVVVDQKAKRRSPTVSVLIK